MMELKITLNVQKKLIYYHQLKLETIIKKNKQI